MTMNIIEQIRELVGEPNASVTIVLDEGAWGYDEDEDNAACHAEMLNGLDWEGIEIAGREDLGIDWRNSPGVHVHLGDQLIDDPYDQLIDLIDQLIDLDQFIDPDDHDVREAREASETLRDLLARLYNPW